MLFKWILLSYPLTIDPLQKVPKNWRNPSILLNFIAKSVLQIILKALEIVVHVFKRGDLYKASIKLIYTDKCMYYGSKQILVHEAYFNFMMHYMKLVIAMQQCLKCVKVQDEHCLVLAVDLSL